MQSQRIRGLRTVSLSLAPVLSSLFLTAAVSRFDDNSSIGARLLPYKLAFLTAAVRHRVTSRPIKWPAQQGADDPLSLHRIR